MKISFIRFAILIFGAGLSLGHWRPAIGGTAVSTPDLRAFYDAHDWFKLRDAIAGKDAAPLYRGAVAAAFNRTDEAAAALHPLINSTMDSKDADEADDWLSYLFVRQGLYQEATAEMDDGTPLLSLLRTLPDQVVSRFAPSAVACRLYQQRLFLPLMAGGTAAEFFLDSDANFSFMSESEAKNLGLTVRESSLKVHGAGGIPTGFRIAVVDTLSIGNMELKHVAFIVMPDGEAPFAHLKTSQQGAIGLPVLLAFRTLHYKREVLEIGQTLPVTQVGEQNLCFDGLDPVADVSVGQQKWPFILDTGAAQTELWLPLLREFPSLLRSNITTGIAVESSFGGTSLVPQKRFGQFALAFGGFDLRLPVVNGSLEPTTQNSKRYAGRLGLDALTFPREVTIDFERLQLTAK